MSHSTQSQKVDAYGRRQWDKEYYKARATEKIGKEEEVDALLPPPKTQKVFPPAHLRGPLHRRDKLVDLDAELGKTKVVTAHTPKMFQGGYWCETCECLIKDSQAFLDHVNGKKHNRLLGMTMQVERVSVQQVQNKLKTLSKRKLGVFDASKGEVEDIEMRWKLLKAQDEEKKLRRKEKKRKKGGNNREAENSFINEAEEDEERKLRASMGFPEGFAGQ